VLVTVDAQLPRYLLSSSLDQLVQGRIAVGDADEQGGHGGREEESQVELQRSALFLLNQKPGTASVVESPGVVLPFFVLLPVSLWFPAGLTLTTLRKPQEAFMLVSRTGSKRCYPQRARGGDRLSWEEPAGSGGKEAGGCIFVTRKRKENHKGAL